jgi:hypothetical protein
MDTWAHERNFHALSIRDLLDAREAYHVHLAHLENVTATAIGRYLIRNKDPDTKDPNAHSRSSREPRTLHNTDVQKWSWPCVLVFVREWQPRSYFRKNPGHLVPPLLYLPDGRVIPTCVVFADPDTQARPTGLPPQYPSDLIGGGYPVFTEVQGQVHLGSLGCLVTDGDSTYALTNRHVAGPVGRPVYTVVAGTRQQIGQSAGIEVGKRRFSEVYPGWPGTHSVVNLDLGLVRVDNVSRWTAQVYGIGQLGPVWDLHTNSFNLDMIGCPVVAHGAASGRLEGQIKALFFRYKTMGGVDYVSDFLIGPRDEQGNLGTKGGDSGTIWFEDNKLTLEEAQAQGKAGKQAKLLRPFAVQWGAQALLSAGGPVSQDFALATALSTACRELDVEIIPSWNVGHPETWGAVGHFKVGNLACEFVRDSKLGKLFKLNQDNIGYSDQTLSKGLPGYKKGTFVPLADVADFVWRSSRKLDASNHFADMDQPATTGTHKGETLLSLTKGKPQNVDPQIWNEFYESIGEAKRGALPFRVWQMYDEMTDFARDGDLLKFLCTGGLMAHYVGDACQPLHVSRFHHGLHKDDESEAGVHSAYETQMLNSHVSEMIAEIAKAKSKLKGLSPVTGGGQDAAVAVVELMRRTIGRIAPLDLVNFFNDHPGRGRSQSMWDEFGEATAECLTDGAMTLAAIWDGAWKRGRKSGAKKATWPKVAYEKKKLMSLYNTKNFVQSYKLQDIVREGNRLVENAE